MKSYQFPSGQMPAIGLGTWKMEDNVATEAVKTAIELGYRHIDCAPIYLNESDVGRALRWAMTSHGIPREDLWITSKLWCNRHRPDLVQSAIKQTLFDLKLDYLDLYMIHWPIVFRDDRERPESADDFISLDEMPLIDTWRAMEECVDAGLCRNLGVCNFNRHNLQSILDGCRVPLSANQVECQPYLNQRELFDFCAANDIQPVAYSPLGSGDRPERMRSETDPNLFEDPTLKEVAERNSLSLGQLMLAWSVQRGAAAIPKSTNPNRLTDNLAAAGIPLPAEDMETIESLPRRHRYVHGKFWEVPGGPYTAAGIWGETGE